MLAGLQVQHELAERPLQPRELSLQHHEPGAGDPRGGFEVHQPETRAQVHVVLGRRDGEGLAPAAHLDIAALVLARRHILGRQVRKGGQEVEQGFGARLLDLGLFGDLRLEQFDLGHQVGGAGLVLLGLGHADQLGDVVPARLGRLQSGLGRAKLSVDRQNRIGLGR